MESPSQLDEKKTGTYSHDEVIDKQPTAAALAAAIPKVNLHELSPEEAARAADKIAQVRNAAYEAAIRESPIKIWSASSRMLFWTVGVCLLGACTNGYDGSLFSGISPMIQYQDYYEIGTVGPRVSQVFSMYTVGSLVGAFFAGPIADKWGRRMAMSVGGFIILVGCIIVSTAQKFEGLVGGRFVLGFGIAIVTVGAPALCVEVAPPQWRGKFVGVYNCGWNGGSIPAALVTYLCINIQSTWSFRIPFILQGMYGGLIMILCWTVPESPRWLMQNGKTEEALAWLVKYHGNGNPDSALVALEFEEFQENITFNGSDKRWWDYRALFASKNARWRFVMVCMISVFGQFSGNGLGYFSNVIYNNLGYTDPKTVLALNLGGSFLSAVCSLTAAALTDRMPRIKVLTFGTLLMSGCLLGNGLCSTFWAKQPQDSLGHYINPNLALGQAGLFFNFAFGVVYAFTYTPLQGVYPSENLRQTERAKGLAFSGVVVSLIGFINTYAGPIALQNMANNYIYVFVGWDIIEALCWWFFGVETQGRTMEQLEEIYNMPYPPFASRKYEEVALANDGKIVGIVKHDSEL